MSKRPSSDPFPSELRIGRSESYLTSPGRSTRSDFRSRKLKWKRWVFGLPVALIAPFIVLIRLSTWLYLEKAANGWLAIAVSAGVAALLLALTVALIARKIGARPGKRMFQATGLAVIVYALYLLLYVSAANLKSDELRGTYRQLHPILRVAVSSMILVDGKVVITDTRRMPEDYAAMGLSARDRSMHYPQADGYVHALDLRTKGRSELLIGITRVYFETMGFSTLRHVGTADHLHVTLSNR